jgi:hypothetical protein
MKGSQKLSSNRLRLHEQSLVAFSGLLTFVLKNGALPRPTPQAITNADAVGWGYPFRILWLSTCSKGSPKISPNQQRLHE